MIILLLLTFHRTSTVHLATTSEWAWELVLRVDGRNYDGNLIFGSVPLVHKGNKPGNSRRNSYPLFGVWFFYWKL